MGDIVLCHLKNIVMAVDNKKDTPTVSIPLREYLEDEFADQRRESDSLDVKINKVEVKVDKLDTKVEKLGEKLDDKIDHLSVQIASLKTAVSIHSTLYGAAASIIISAIINYFLK